MNPPSPSILISRRILQTSDVDAFNGIPQSSASPTTSAALRTPFNPTTPFDSSMALTILVLLTALFFLGFFSVYIRRFAAVSDPPQHRPPTKFSGGLDAAAINSLPTVAYGRDAKHPMIDDCPICLTEFRVGQTVKLIPYCSHVFHPSCLDTWLASHVTCPLCRSSELFKRVPEVRLDVAPDRDDIRAPGLGERSTDENGGSAGVKRSCSCSNLANPTVLQRSISF